MIPTHTLRTQEANLLATSPLSPCLLGGGHSLGTSPRPSIAPGATGTQRVWAGLLPQRHSGFCWGRETYILSYPVLVNSLVNSGNV